ncbi:MULTISPECIES: hypothetical protein [unclassified Chelatococcus]|uniref:hypothetical protein n=1 Tax=unclassified Chelatococcus TaxID=2638111 RepID=UPI001BCD4018|nr:MULTISPECIES: hypothetical protein [unclassified Chelatococcus]MBS7697395.1 hypothetical protein [Chelatococcus sp. YT9]MBX3559992.1 hypothetical protein [Chelatococcus sp.]
MQLRHALAEAVPLALSAAAGTAVVGGGGNMGALLAGHGGDGTRFVGRALGSMAIQPLWGMSRAGIVSPISARMTSMMMPTDRPLPRPNVDADHILFGVALFTETAKAVLVAAFIPAGAPIAVFVTIDLGVTFASTAIAHFAMARYDQRVEWPEPPQGVSGRTILWGMAAGVVDALVTALGAGFTYLVQSPGTMSRCMVAGIVGCGATGIRGYMKDGLMRLRNWGPSTSTPAYADL